MRETKLWEWLKPRLPEGQYSRIESGDTAPGFPDVYYRLRGGTGTIELKVSQNPKAEVPFRNEDDGLHKSQIRWIQANIRLKGTVWIVARIGDDILFIPGRYCQVFNGAKAKYLYAISSLVLTMGKVKLKDLRILKNLLETST